MKILHVTYSLASDQGGPPIVTTRLAAAQAELGYQVTIVTRVSEAKETVLPVIAGARPLKIDRIAGLGGGASTALERVIGHDARATLCRSIAAHDIVHIHNIWDPILIHAVNIARAMNKPTILSPHGILTRWALSQKKFKKWLAMALVYRRSIQKISLLHALSRFEERELRAFGWRGPIVRIPNGVPLQEIDPLPERGSFRAAHPELGQDPFVLFMSRVAPIKGVGLLIDAFASALDRCPNARLVIVGPDFGMEDSVREQSLRLGIASRVHLLGPIFDRRKFEAMVDCACFCLPSGFEAFSVAIAEAMACGAPVVISHECHFHAVKGVGAGFLVYRTVPSITHALESILTDPVRRESMGRAGRALIEQRYTWKIVAGHLVDAYRSIQLQTSLPRRHRF